MEKTRWTLVLPVSLIIARPLKEIDADQVFKLARLGCTQEEIGEFFGVSHQTVGRRFGQEYALGRGASKISLRRAQFKSALGGCATMQIHLGKQYLGQTDRLDLQSGGKPIAYVERASNPRDVHRNGVAPQSALETVGPD
jgi:hypothetical protein